MCYVPSQDFSMRPLELIVSVAVVREGPLMKHRCIQTVVKSSLNLLFSKLKERYGPLKPVGEPLIT